MQSFPPPPPHLTACGVPIAYVRIVDAMPFVNALRPTLRLRLVSRDNREHYALYDGARLLSSLDVTRDKTGTNVDIENAAPSPSDPSTAIVLDTARCRASTALHVQLTEKP